MGIGTESKAADAMAMSPQGLNFANLNRRDIPFQFPHLNGFIPTRRGKGLGIGTEGNVVHPVLMSGEDSQFFTPSTPEANGFVPSSGGNILAVGTKGDAGHFPVVSRKGLSIATLQIPKFDRAVVTGTGEGFAVGAKGEIGDSCVVSANRSQQGDRIFL